MKFQAIAVLGALIIAIAFGQIMYDISQAMTEMTDHVGAISRDVKDMRDSMHDINGNIIKMSESMDRMETSMRGMGKAFSEGSEQFQQWNPATMMKQVVPAQPRRTP